MKKLLFKIFVTASLISALCIPAFARTAYRLPAEDGGNGTVTVSLLDSKGGAIKDGALSVFKVADITTDNEKFLYTVAGDFAGFTDENANESFDEYLLNLDKDFDLSQNAYFAKSLEKYTKQNDLTAYQTVYVDEEGRIAFTNLTNGLYLVVQTVRSKGYNPMSAFLVSVPKCIVDENGDDWYYYEIDAQPKTQPLTKTPPPPPEEPETPNTGLPWMPVIAMAVLGLGLFFIGYMKHKKAETND